MTYLGFEDILTLQQSLDPPLVAGLSPDQLIAASEGGTAEGPCLEIRIGRVFAAKKDRTPVLSYDHAPGEGSGKKIIRYVPDADVLLQVDDAHPLGTEFRLAHGDSCLIESIETLNLPNRADLSIVAVVTPRFSLARMGIAMLASDADPGYSGKIVTHLVNIGPYATVHLALGTRIAKVRFARTTGQSPSYVGAHGGKAGGILEER